MYLCKIIWPRYDLDTTLQSRLHFIQRPNMVCDMLYGWTQKHFFHNMSRQNTISDYQQGLLVFSVLIKCFGTFKMRIKTYYQGGNDATMCKWFAKPTEIIQWLLITEIYWPLTAVGEWNLKLDWIDDFQLAISKIFYNSLNKIIIANLLRFKLWQ